MIVYLIGMPASGKTNIGKRVAKKTEFTFLDLDNYLADKENKSVAIIFAEQGEKTFRELETKYRKKFQRQVPIPLFRLAEEHLVIITTYS